MKILLICAAGMSTSLIVKKMYEIAPEGTQIDYGTGGQIESLIDNYDVVLVGPQLRYKKEQLIKLAAKKNKPIDFIDSVTYGRLKGKEIYEQALNLLNKKE